MFELNENFDEVNWPKSYYVFVERVGEFTQTAPEAWKNLHQCLSQIQSPIVNYTALYKFRPQKIYRAGVFVGAKPTDLPPGVTFEEFNGGKYSRFILRGPYTKLPEACARVMKIAEVQLQLRDGFFIENYVNDPSKTPEANLLTEILVPTV